MAKIMHIKGAGEETYHYSEILARTVLDSISAHIAILYENGTIIETNQAWQEHADRNLMQVGPDSVGINDLNICEAATGKDAGDARKVNDGIRTVLDGDIEETLQIKAISIDRYY